MRLGVMPPLQDNVRGPTPSRDFARQTGALGYINPSLADHVPDATPGVL